MMAQRPILSVTLNPALDLSSAVDAVEPGPKLRCDMPHTDPGGGGINVSRMIGILGGRSMALVALGGATGTRIAAMLRAAGLDLAPFEGAGRDPPVAGCDRSSRWRAIPLRDARPGLGCGAGRAGARRGGGAGAGGWHRGSVGLEFARHSR